MYKSFFFISVPHNPLFGTCETDWLQYDHALPEKYYVEQHPFFRGFISLTGAEIEINWYLPIR